MTMPKLLPFPVFSITQPEIPAPMAVCQKEMVTWRVYMEVVSRVYHALSFGEMNFVILFEQRPRHRFSFADILGTFVCDAERA
jgi:hypothetical protein